MSRVASVNSFFSPRYSHLRRFATCPFTGWTSEAKEGPAGFSPIPTDLIELHHMLRRGQHKDAANPTIFEQFY